MPLTPGTRLGPYEISSALGAGGMGEVYRARDTRLGRDVAIKVLPAALSTNPETRARFEREARSVSSLNHPHICTLHDVGREGDVDYLVMELIEGETLADRLARGPLPLADVLKLGAQIADALDRAHRAGVIHRDLKPGNVMITKAGAKLMDFGLARAAGPASQPGSGVSAVTLTHSPTMAGPLTAEGLIVGTFQYMAPEQLEGHEADARSDVWSLGCVLYEMVSGRRAFEGKSQASLITAIMGSEPQPVSQVAPLTPPALDRLIRMCLNKDPDERVRTAHDVKLQLLGIAEGGSQAGVPVPAVAAGAAARRGNRERLAWIVALAAVIVAAAALALAPRFGPGGDRSAKVVRFSVAAPEGRSLFGAGGTTGQALSPDGRWIAFVAVDSAGGRSLWVRPLESLAPRELPGTEGASYPFWSPDGGSLGFYAEGKLKRIPLAGGRPQVLCPAISGRGGTWNHQGEILFSPAAQSPLFRILAAGGDPVQVTALDSTRHEIAHRWPQFLPDGRHFLYLALPPRDGQHDIYMGSLDGKPARLVARSDRAAVYAPPGYLLLVRNETMLAQRFDAGRGETSGEPVSLDEVPATDGHLGEPNASVSNDGVLAWRMADPPVRRLVWLDDAGKPSGVIPMQPGPYTGVRVSPTGRHAALWRNDPQTMVDIWLVELERGTTTRFTSDPGNEGVFPTWSPDGGRMAFGANGKGPYDIYVRPVTGSGQEELLHASGVMKKWPRSWAPDGRSIVFDTATPETGDDIQILPLEGDRTPVPYLGTRFNENGGAISPDGRWLAYNSDESGRVEVYVQPFPVPGAKTQVSTDGGFLPAWSRDGRTLYFGKPDGTVFAADIEAGIELRASVPRARFTAPRGFFALSYTGERWLCLIGVGAERPSTITVVVNWAAGLKDE